jgi:hypothetical protein
LKDGDFRRSVLDSSTAAEIAMTKLLDHALANSSAAAASLVRQKWRQIYGLSQALREFGVTLPTDISNTGMAEPRNKAVHEGMQPTKEQTSRCLEIAREVVELATPLKSLL